jgi:AP-3 complex subunit delta-1
MASKKFQHKRVGYLAASLSFKQNTSVMLLCTNLIRKDLLSGDVAEVGLALSGLSNMVTEDLAKTIMQDVGMLLGHSKASVRKKALLMLLRMLNLVKDQLPNYLSRIFDRLHDTDKCMFCAIFD